MISLRNRKIIKIGNAYGITIPKDDLDRSKLKQGQKIDVNIEVIEENE